MLWIAGLIRCSKSAFHSADPPRFWWERTRWWEKSCVVVSIKIPRSRRCESVWLNKSNPCGRIEVDEPNPLHDPLMSAFSTFTDWFRYQSWIALLDCPDPHNWPKCFPSPFRPSFCSPLSPSVPSPLMSHSLRAMNPLAGSSSHRRECGFRFYQRRFARDSRQAFGQPKAGCRQSWCHGSQGRVCRTHHHYVGTWENILLSSNAESDKSDFPMDCPWKFAVPCCLFSFVVRFQRFPWILLVSRFFISLAID